MHRTYSTFTLFLASLMTPVCFGQQVTLQSADQDNKFHFPSLPSPSNNDAGSIAKLVTAGSVDRNSADVQVLIDGKVPSDRDQPKQNFFFSQKQGRLLFDLTDAKEIKSINTYSWHPSSRLDQRYTVWVAPIADKDQAETFDNEAWKTADDLASAGWIKVSEVDSRETDKVSNRPLAVQIANEDKSTLATSQFVLFEIQQPNPDQRFSDTFFSEIDIVDGKEYETPALVNQIDSIKTETGVEIIFDTSDLPEIREWVNQTLKPICRTWYPKIAETLASEDFTPPQKFTIFFHRDMDGVAYTQGIDVHCAGVWFQRNLNGEAAGAVVHELVHVIQQYRGGRRRNRNPGWMVEGVADYVRWFQYEPQTNRPHPNFARANYDDSYRTSAAFLDFVMRTYDADLLSKFNAAMRERRYSDELWVEWTKKSPAELWEEYKASVKAEREARNK